MPTPYLVAVVEDDPGLLSDLVEFLTLRGFAAYGFGCAEDFLAVWPATRFDVLLLDVALPGASGLDIAQRVRAQDTEDAGTAPGVVMLTALDANEDQVLGLNAGADLYLSKRSSLEVIEAACHSLLRRLGHGQPCDSWRLQPRYWRLRTPTGGALELTQDEVSLLSMLCAETGQTVAREALLARLGKAESLSSLRNLDNTVSRLRRKTLAACGQELPIRSSYGKGYTFTGHCEIEA